MGAYSPCDFISDQEEFQIQQIFSRVLKAMKASGHEFEGFLFAGLMKTENGINVLEFNVRMGDPETQALFPLLKDNLLIGIQNLYDGKPLTSIERQSGLHSVHVVAVSEGYPSKKMNLGQQIKFETPDSNHLKLYFSGVQFKDNNLINSGGRVFGVTALADSKNKARDLAYTAMKKNDFSGMYYRKDIAE
jgi:phosphoribosylamine--glycine ligase